MKNKESISIDFETRSVMSLKAGVSKYAESAEILCLAYTISEGPVRVWRPDAPPPNDLFLAIYKGYAIHAHNAAFERAIWRKVMVEQYGWPLLPDTQWRCTMAECLASAIPASLDEASKALKLDAKKDMAGKRVMQKMSKPRKPTKNDKSLWHDSPQLRETLENYCAQDVVTEMAIGEKIAPLSDREISIFQFDQRVNDRGVKIDRTLAQSAIWLWSAYAKKLNSELSDLTFGHVVSSNEVSRILTVLKWLRVELPTLDKKQVSEALTNVRSVTAKRILEIRKELAKSSIKKFERMLLCAESDDRIRGCFQYHGAGQTGRWAGRLVQLQNLPRGGLKAEHIEQIVSEIKGQDLEAVLKHGPLGETLSSIIRSAIIAEDGKRLLVSDFASVEARGLAWAADEKWLLKAFGEGQDVYVEMASSIYRIPTEEVTKDHRWYGKTVILGCGFQLGADGFQRTLDNFGVKEDKGFCEEVVRSYRAKNKRIVGLWYKMEDAAISCVESLKPQKCGVFTFHIMDGWLCMRLPSGRDIKYYAPRLVAGSYKQQIRYTGTDVTGRAAPKDTYGGKLVENAIQAICRDLMVEAMSRLERAGYTVIAHVHDEIVCEVDDSFGSIEEMEAIMKQTPKWAEGFPIGAEGFECKRYRK